MRATIDWDNTTEDDARRVALKKVYERIPGEKGQRTIGSRFKIVRIRMRSSCFDGIHLEILYGTGSPFAIRTAFGDDPVRIAIDRSRYDSASDPKVMRWYLEGTLFSVKWSGTLDRDGNRGGMNAGPWETIYLNARLDRSTRKGAF